MPRAPAVLLAAACTLGCGARTALDIGASEAPYDAAVDAPPCAPRAESCNGLDDDCDGRLDEGLPLSPLGDAILVRDETELDAGDCSVCRWAWSPVLAPTDEGGYLALFRISIYGGREEPNVFTRSLDRRGVPIGPNRSAGPEVALDLAALSPAATREGARPIATCWRRGASDLPGLTLVARSGAITRSVFADARHCEQLVLAGDRAVSVAALDRRLEVTSRRYDGTDSRRSGVSLENVYFATAASWGDRVGVVMLHIEDDVRQLYFAVLDSLGATIVAPRAIDAPYESYPRLVGTSEGWLLVMPSRRAPARRATITRDGVLATALTPFDDAHVLADSTSSEELAHHPSAPMIAHVFQASSGELGARMHVQLLDERGDLLRAFEDDAPGSGAVASPSTAFTADGRLLVAWHDIAGDGAANRVYVRELGCAR